MTFEEFRHFQETESSIRRGESPSGSCSSLLAPLTLEGLRDNNAINSAFSVEREKTEKNSSFLAGRFFSKLFTEQSEVNNRLSRSSSKNFESGLNSPENGTVADLSEKRKENEKAEEKVKIKSLDKIEGKIGGINTTLLQPVGPKIDDKNVSSTERTLADTALKDDEVVVKSTYKGVGVGNVKNEQIAVEGEGEEDDESQEDDNRNNNNDNDDDDDDDNSNNNNNDDLDDDEMGDVEGGYLVLQDDSYDDNDDNDHLERSNTRKI